MLQRPLYQTSIAFLSLLALAGGVALLLAQGGPPGVVITPSVEQSSSGTTAPLAGPEVVRTDDTSEPNASLIDINAATLDELVELPGVGPVLAARIVEFREANGDVERADLLMAVSGIGPATYEAVRDLITVGY
jgi:competence protein ComEA